MKHRLSLRAIFAAPLIIALTGVIGLVTALAGDGWHDAVAWASLAVPVLAVVWAVGTRRS